jgi:signal transduction histidine kinase
VALSNSTDEIGDVTRLTPTRPITLTPEVSGAFEHIARTMIDPLAIYSPDWRILFLNDAAGVQLTRFGGPGAMIGRSLFEIFPDLHGTPFEREMRHAMEARVTTTFTEVRPSTGRWASVRCDPLPDGGLAVTWRDVTEQRLAERTLRYLDDASTVLTSSLDLDQTISDLARLVVPELADWCSVSLIDNDRIRLVAVAHTDLEKIELVRKLEARYPSDPNGTTRTANVIRTGATDMVRNISDEMLEKAIGDPVYREAVRSLGLSSVLTVPIQFGGRTIGAMSLVMIGSRGFNDGDIGLAEELGRRAGIAVEHARLYREAVDARQSAEEANAAKVEFLARMSHELRTPLNAIAGFADLLAMGVRGGLAPQQLEDVRRIQRNQQHLQSLISDILNYAKIEAGRLKYDVRPMPARTAVRAIEQVYSAQFSMQDLTWVSDFEPPDTWVMADGDRLQQILMNLLGNAVKFTPRGGRIAIRGRVRGSEIEITVTDTGSGIPEEKLEVVFDPFVQVPRPGEVSTGTGLGLAIARDLARGMDGDLRAEKNPSGATFVLTLKKAVKPRVSGENRRTAGS